MLGFLVYAENNCKTALLRSDSTVALWAGLKGYFEIFIPRISGNFLYSRFSDIAAKGFINIPNTIRYSFRITLGNHLDSTIEQITNKTVYSITPGYIESRKSKADPLNSTGENYMFGNLLHCCRHPNLYPAPAQEVGPENEKLSK